MMAVIYANRTKTAVTLLLSTVLLVSSFSRSKAEFIPFFGNMGPFLNREDFTLADAAVHKLMDPQPAPLGAAVDWNNPISGNSGILTMGRTYHKKGYDCRVVQWHDVFRDGTQRTVMLNTCHISGVWKLM
jgi:surface antigen